MDCTRSLPHAAFYPPTDLARLRESGPIRVRRPLQRTIYPLRFPCVTLSHEAVRRANRALVVFAPRRESYRRRRRAVDADADAVLHTRRRRAGSPSLPSTLSLPSLIASSAFSLHDSQLAVLVLLSRASRAAIPIALSSLSLDRVLYLSQYNRVQPS